MIILPRQARDKHRENSKKARFLEGADGVGSRCETAFLSRFIYAENDHFTKTGSGRV